MATFHPLIFLIIHISFLFSAVSAATFTVTNNCHYTVWPGVLSGAGHRPHSSTTGFALQTGESQSIPVPTGWSGRFWGRTLCSTDATGKFTCATGDCGSSTVQCSGSGAAPPATLAEFTLNGSDGKDFYDVSLVDGYNLPMLVVPQSGSGNCSSTGCLVDLNGLCPSDLKVTESDGDGVACRSACEAFGSPEYCCSGAYGNPNTCKPTQYSQFFKNACPRAYSYAYDDATSTFTCTNANYLITFCPGTTSQKSGENSNSNSGNNNNGGNPQAALPLINSTMVFLGGDDVPAPPLIGGSSPRAQVASPFVLWPVAIGLTWFLIRGAH
ncbi:thaumatin-like protein 1b [Asparagus officinalis]|uniref:thaumatin-like protein 1b n=1 Tax=Asparagus officinalis TaxID=4686 RepID=UPI00098DEDAE|nr:thaumatin-like protein 1b [Asparagus officinalis]